MSPTSRSLRRAALPALFAVTTLLTGALPGQRPEGAQTRFDVHQHGFNFVNYFAGDILVDLPILGRVDLGDSTYGLCGGMVYAASDTFFSGGTAPDYTTPPGSTGPAEVQPGQPMRSYLYDRQVDSLKAENGFVVRRVIAWSARPIETNLGITGLRVLSDRQFKDRISKRLDDGKPVPLCLIKTDLAGDFTKNHQVLAIGYRKCPATDGMKQHWAIDIYDPNHPDEVHTLHYSDEGRAQTRRIDADGKLVADPDNPKQNKVGTFRGFFVTPYEVKLPFWVKPDVNRLGRLARIEALVINEPPEEGFDEPGARLAGVGDRTGPRGAAAKPGQGGGSKPGTGLDGLPVPDVKAAEGDTAAAIRGKPGQGYRMAAGPANYRRLGRVVVQFPEGTGAGTKVEILDADDGSSLDSQYGGRDFDLLPGSYGVRVGGKLVEAVPVEARQDTVVRCGGLQIEAGNGQKVEVLDADEQTVLQSGYGKLEVGLPVGAYFVRVQKRNEPVTVREGEVTQF